MIVIASAADLAGAWQLFRWRHPEWTLALVATGAWMAVFSTGAAAPDHVSAGPALHTRHVVPTGAPTHYGVGMAGWHWIVMVAAMMLPTILPAARWVALGGRWRRRQRGQALFALGYLSGWIVVGLVASGVLRHVVVPLPTPWILTGALALAAAWELTGWKVGFLLACHRVRPIPPDGWRADAACVLRGLANARSCVGACWALMIPMVLADHIAAMWVMLPTTVAILLERFATRPAAVVRPVAAGLVAGALISTLV